MSHSQQKQEEITAAEREVCLRVLQQVSEDPSVIDADERMKALIAKIHRSGKKGERRANQERRQQSDIAARQETAMVRRDREAQPLAREAASSDVSAAADTTVGTLHRSMRCYICKQPFDRVHFFYHLLCPECAALNYAKRQQRADLSGRTAVLTGGRIKIGYQMALRLLRDGAKVIVTTRFPGDAARRFAAEEDFPVWRDRLTVYALDLRNLPTVEAFAAHLAENEAHLDILINNAAQTVKRPLAFYRHLLEAEQGSDGALMALPFSGKGSELARPSHGNAPVLLEALAQYPALMDSDLLACFPAGALDVDGQQIDKRAENSWSLRLHEVSTLELLETHLVNAVAPFILCRRLKPLLLRSPFSRRFVVNVSAMEGQFGRHSKTARHPHTNMAKAALNMLTRTCAADLAEDGIYMNSVDTGWITDEKPFERRVRHQEQAGFHTPLDVIDGTARVYDPVARGVSEPDAPPLSGYFLKDYQPYPW